jgi:uncharacterized protein with GYD domain
LTEGAAVPTYVSLINWTDQGVRNYRDTVSRSQSFRDMAAQAGCQVRETLWTIGEYDLVAVIEAPDDGTAVAVLLQSAQLGNIRTRTMRALTADEMTGVINRIG